MTPNPCPPVSTVILVSMMIPNIKPDLFLFSCVPATPHLAFSEEVSHLQVQKGNTPGPAWHTDMGGKNICSSEVKPNSKPAVCLFLSPLTLTTSGLKVRTQLSGALYYGAESEFAFSLEWKRATEKQKAKPLQPSSGLHRRKANTVRMVCPPTAGACLLLDSCVGR